MTMHMTTEAAFFARVRAGIVSFCADQPTAG